MEPITQEEITAATMAGVTLSDEDLDALIPPQVKADLEDMFGSAPSERDPVAACMAAFLVGYKVGEKRT